jgi:glycosyltransferase involved in cell wall biosynthesis
MAARGNAVTDATANEPLSVAVVVDNFNYGRFVADAVESALAQTYPHVKVYVVDDGSTDESRDVLAEYADRVELVFKSNGGQASAFNAGFERCREDVVIFLDADDMLLPHAAELAVDAFAADPQLVKVQSHLEVIYGPGEPTIVIPDPHLPLPNGDVRADELRSPFDLVWVATSGNAFRRTALERILPIPETRFARSADWYLVHLVALLGPVRSLTQVGARYRVHGQNSYQLLTDELSLPHVRATIAFAAETENELLRLADELHMPRARGPVLSVADVAHRLISLRLDPAEHPRRDDTRAKLLVKGVRAALRRRNVRWPLRLAYIGWFVATAIAPDPAVRHLANWFLFSSHRRALNRVLGRLNRRRKPR